MQFFSAVEGGPLDLPYARTKGAAMVAESFDDVSFRLALSRKDGDLLLEAVADAGLEIPILEAQKTEPSADSAADIAQPLQ